MSQTFLNKCIEQTIKLVVYAKTGPKRKLVRKPTKTKDDLDIYYQNSRRSTLKDTRLKAKSLSSNSDGVVDTNLSSNENSPRISSSHCRTEPLKRRFKSPSQ